MHFVRLTTCVTKKAIFVNLDHVFEISEIPSGGSRLRIAAGKDGNETKIIVNESPEYILNSEVYV